LWLLVEFISRRMDQLNFPISSLEVAKGMTSEVVQLVEPASRQIVNTGWLRRLKSSRRVIYAGLYSATPMPDEAGPCVKVTFPCRGSANVYLSRWRTQTALSVLCLAVRRLGARGSIA